LDRGQRSFDGIGSGGERDAAISKDFGFGRVVDRRSVFVGGFEAAEFGQRFVESALGGEAHAVETGDGGLLAEGKAVGGDL
jgi:hypothetical protein